jgi:membrane dipeptidase
MRAWSELMTTDSRLNKLISDSVLWDSHAGIFPDAKSDLSGLELWVRNGFSFLSVNIAFDLLPWQQAIGTLAAYRAWIVSHPETYVLVDKVDDVVRAKRDRKLAVSFDIEGMNALNGDINMVQLYHALGVRQMLFAYNLNNAAGGGCHDRDVGLTDFGRAVVKEMNRVGMLVDCSHSAYRTTMEAMEISSAPVIFSHSNPTSVCNHGRNIRDDQIKACAATGGVIGINGLGIFLGDNDISTKTIARHIDYLVDLVGARHVGLGFDYAPPDDIDLGTILRGRPDFWPAGQRYDTPDIKVASPSQTTELVEALLKGGYSDADISGILGGNFRRVASQVWH